MIDFQANISELILNSVPPSKDFDYAVWANKGKATIDLWVTDGNTFHFTVEVPDKENINELIIEAINNAIFERAILEN